MLQGLVLYNVVVSLHVAGVPLLLEPWLVVVGLLVHEALDRHQDRGDVAKGRPPWTLPRVEDAEAHLAIPVKVW
eukprot:CAMPEP_0204015792 /NCGR_PEP_ID=MMETSP0360-20130528/26306_1 /ASSEMBLY_ACC=CAM_ASM_000342 /TAXON_ID=268821 /ORGANISM="Scrippsiella Hangoei, Strain SHTV-5" /LENGTH=73 /DNA_ID=CAMNT_0050958737 /DNA_START=260 /DNA_END=478 /DNA_ORIENTATION=-